MKKLRAAVLVAVASMTGAVLSATPATAAPSPASICGSGYGVIDSAASTYVRLYLLYSRTSGKNCAVAIHLGSAYGPSHKISIVGIENKSGRIDTDGGPGSLYSKYAGPVYVSGKGQCVRAWAALEYKGASRRASIPWGHCS
ncbi:hypothetical protein GCM10020220_030250 [Nonomuraea rubra]